MTEARLQALLDESEIRRVVAEYARGFDRSDWEQVRRCYHPDATDDHGEFKGPAADFFGWAKGRAERRGGWQRHLLGQQLIELDGDVAWSETYCVSFWRGIGDGDGEWETTVHVRFVDRFERRDDAWKIAHRLVVFEPGRKDEIAAETHRTALHTPWANDRTDPSYRREP